MTAARAVAPPGGECNGRSTLAVIAISTVTEAAIMILGIHKAQFTRLLNLEERSSIRHPFVRR